MRFLKKKIALSLLLKQKAKSPPLQANPQLESKKGSSQPAERCYQNPTKGLCRNYGRAISSFALSSLALPYIRQQKIMISFEQWEGFRSFVKVIRRVINGTDSLRAAVLVTQNDSGDILIYKRTFQILAEIFIKFYSVQWITHSKRLSLRTLHLKYRYKVLKLILNPELYTSLALKKHRA